MIQLITNSSIEFQVILMVLLISLMGQLFYAFYFYARVVKKRSLSQKARNLSPVSVIICAKNEANNLRINLPFILNQKYKKFEVVIVNDCSEDDTEEVLSELKNNFTNLVVTSISKDQKFTHGKKLALTVGIKAAKNEWLLLTDADCRPASNQWIKTMAMNFHENKELILGYGAYRRVRGILNNIQRYDTVFIAMQYLGFALAGVPYMGVGRNIAYRKSSFFKNKGFASHYHVASGDDDLLVNEIATKKNTVVEFTSQSHTLSDPSRSFRLWFIQKRRHLSTSRYYKAKFKILLAMELIFRFLFYTSAIVLLFHNELYFVGIAAFLVRAIVQLTIFKNVMNRLKEKDLLLPSLVYDIIMPVINLVLGLLNVISRNRYSWK